MDQHIYAEVEKLRDFLNRNYKKKFRESESPIALNGDILWDASRFWAYILYKGESISVTGSEAAYSEFKTDYEIKRGIILNDEKLFERFWLRKVLGFIEIPGTISFAILTFKDIKKYKAELEFWSQFQKESDLDSPTYTFQETEDARKVYEDENGIKLDDDGLYKTRWARVEADKVKVSNIEVYFKQYLDNWQHFEFIEAYIEKIQESRKESLRIAHKDLEEYHKNFKTLFPEIPEIDVFVNEGILDKSDSAYTISFDKNNIYWFTLKNKIAGFLWELLVKDVGITSDQERVKLWLVKTGYWEYFGSPLGTITTGSKQAFLDAAFDLVTTDPDLEGVDNEMEKVALDGTHSKGTIHATRSNFVQLKNQDLFELLASLNMFEDGASTTYLHDQRSRHYMAILIRLIVKTDRAFEKIIKLLKLSINKPYLLWETKQFILIDRRDVIADLLIDEELTAVAFTLIDEIDYPAEEKEFLNKELWKKGTELYLKSVTLEQTINEPLVSKTIFQIFRQLNFNKYQLPYNYDKDKYAASQKSKKQKEELVLKTIENCPYYQGHYYNSHPGHYLLPHLFDDLAEYFINYKGQSRYRNGTIQFPMMQWDGLIWLLKTSTFYQYSEQLKSRPVNIRKITDAFISGYLNVIEMTAVAKYDYKEKKDKQGLPLWSEKIERLDNLEWIYPIYFIYQEGKLDTFLNPAIEIIVTDDLYLDKNKFAADKLRTHIGIMMQVLKKLVLPDIPFGFEKKILDAIKEKIEAKITEYITIHTENAPKNGKLDLFEFNKEVHFNGNGNEALLPQIARAVNWFSKKDLIIDAILTSGNLTKILTIADYITSEGIRQRLLEKIEQADILAFLEELNWIPEVQNTLIKLSQYPQLTKQIEEAIVYWEIAITEKRTDFNYHIQLFQTKLLLAYFRRNEKEINDIPLPPDKQVRDRRELSPGDYKRFYIGLIKLTDLPEEAYEIFNDLFTQYQNYPVFALNRLAAKHNVADKENSTAELNIALAEWDSAAEKMSASVIEALEPGISSMKLRILYQLNNDSGLDEIFESLSLPDKMLTEPLTIKIDSLVRRNRRDEAYLLIETAEKYHQFGDYADIALVRDLKQRVSDTDNIPELKISYSRIYGSKPAKLIQIFPQNLNGKNSLKEFITQEFVYAADQMLEKIKSIEEIKDEDKYNDLIELVLSAKMNPWGWKIAAQSRGAFSGSIGIQPGERDLPVKDPANKIIMVCEAFIYRGKTTAKSHLEKIFNYYHQRDVFLILVYDTGEKGPDFTGNWKNYMDNIIPAANFNPDYALIPPVIDVSDEFEMGNSAIKVGRSTHESSVLVYHVFININYQLTQSNATASPPVATPVF